MRETFKTADPEMKRLVITAENVAASRATVLIAGESGTGKDLLARLIHDKSPRSSKRFVVVNCAAIPLDTLEAELFGDQSKPGKFELANDSTIHIDEISELPLVLQAKLLRLIQDGEIERIGAKSATKVNVRIVATTSRDLPQLIREGKFREDLYYRLNVVPFNVPALRKRPKDIELLARFFTEVSSHLNGKAPKALAEEALLKMKQWNWPGNVRELENVIERSVLMSTSASLGADDILIQGFEPKAPEWDLPAGITISEAERRLIMKTLEHTAQNRTQAARLLGISIRTLRNKLHEYGVAPAASFNSQQDEIGGTDG